MTQHPVSLPRRLVHICLSLLLPLALIGLAGAGAQEKKDDKKVDKKDDKKEPEKKEPEKKEPPKLDTPLQSYKGHTDWVNSVAYSHDGKHLASGSRDRTVRIWDLVAGKDVHTLKTQPDKTKSVPGVKAVTFVGPGLRVAATTGRAHFKDMKFEDWRGEIKFWDGAKELKSIVAHGDTIECLAATRDGKRLASASEDRLVKIWDVEGGKELFALKGHAGAVLAAAFAPGGKLLASGGEDKTEPKKEPPPKEPKKEKKDKKDKKDKDKKETDTKEKEKEKEKELKKESLPPVPILLWDAETGKEAGTLPGPGRAVTCLAFNQDGTRLAAAGLDGTIKIFDVPGKKLLHTLTAHDGVWAVAFSPDGTKLASGGYDWKITIWDADKGTSLRTIVAHTGTVTCLAFSPDGQHLASGGLDQLIKIWSVK